MTKFYYVSAKILSCSCAYYGHVLFYYLYFMIHSHCDCHVMFCTTALSAAAFSIILFLYDLYQLVFL